MKNFIEKYLVLCLLICCVVFLQACDLSHKHFEDKYGVCQTCGEDTAELLTPNPNQEFISSEKHGRENDFVYFKFVSLGEEFINITVNEITAKVSYVELYTKTVKNLYLSHVSGENVYSYDLPLTQGETYYIRVRLQKAGNIKIGVSPFVES